MLYTNQLKKQNILVSGLLPDPWTMILFSVYKDYQRRQREGLDSTISINKTLNGTTGEAHTRMLNTTDPHVPKTAPVKSSSEVNIVTVVILPRKFIEDVVAM